MEAHTRDILIDELARKKAELISYGSIEIPRSLLSKLSVERSKSGPSSGKSMVGFEFGGKRVKLEASRKNERFDLVEVDGRFIIRDRGKNFLEVRPLDVSTHAPDQIFISLENRCIYNCLFCKKSSIKIDDDRLLNFVKRIMDSKGIRSVAITSGAYPSVKKQIDRIEKFTKMLKESYDDISIGVEPLVESKEDVSRLRSAGADEIKINIQFPRKDLFDKICGYMDHERIFDLLDHAVNEFGKGKVTSNVIFGIGERDEDIEYAIERLTDKGVVPNLRLIRLYPETKKRLESRLGYKIEKTAPSRILKLAIIHKRILERKDLTTRSFKTMCFACGCCDIIPFWDV